MKQPRVASFRSSLKQAVLPKMKKTVLKTKKKKPIKFSMDQFLGPKTTAQSTAEGRMKIATPKKRAILKTSLKKASKKKASKKVSMI